MPAAVLMIVTDVATRERFSRALIVAGYDVLACSTVRAALDRLAISGQRPAAIIIDRRAARAAGVLWTAARATSPLVVHVPQVAVVEGDVLAPDERRGLVVTRTSQVPELLSAVTRAIATGRVAAMPSRTRFARGTGSTASTNSETGARLDLHSFAETKLSQYLGARHGAAMLRSITGELAIERISTTADLHKVAAILRSRGDVEAAVASLLSGRATLLDSERTLDQ